MSETTTTQTQTETAKPKQGQKKCPDCSAIVGARCSVCVHCGHKFAIKSKEGKTDFKSLALLIDKAKAFAVAHGGVESTTALLSSVKAFADEMGGFDALVEGFNTYAELVAPAPVKDVA